MDLEKKLLGACCALALALSGCSHLEKQRAAESEAYASAWEKFDATNAVVTVTNTVPTPPGVAVQKIVTKQRKIHALSFPAPDRYVVVRWDPSADATITWRVTWSGAGSVDWMNVTQSKLDLVEVFKARQVPPGWYKIDVQAVNASYVESDAVSVAFLWLPRQ